MTKAASITIKKLQQYIGVYYEDNVQPKIQASKNILELFQDFHNLQALLQHQSLLPLLARILNQNHKRSIDLSVYLLSIFYILSNYRQFHQCLSQNQVGKLIVDILENQLQRFDLLYSEYIQLWRKNQQKDRLTAKTQLKKLNVLIWKQDKLFFICLNILLNISQNPSIQKKMRKAGISNILCRCLQRNDFHLLIVTLVFLRKISVVAEYKDQLIQINIVQKLQRFFTCQNDVLLNSALFIYYNLAFDKTARQTIQKSSLIPKFVNLLAQDSPNRMISLNIIYLLSTDVGIRYTLAYTNCMDYIMKLIMFPHPNVGAIQLLALALNLTANQRNVQHINQQDFQRLMDKAIKSQDPTLLKLCKSILRSSKSESIHELMKTYIKQKLLKMAMLKSKNEEMSLEVIGIMAYSKIGKHWTDILLSTPKFIQFLSNTMISGVTEDDLLLQIIVLISNICQQAECCTLIERLFDPILAIFLNKEYDPQFITQLLYAIYSYIFHGIGLERILSTGSILLRIIDHIDDPNQGVRQINDQVLTILRETDDIQLAENIKENKFYRHNKRWLTQTQGIQQWAYDDTQQFNEDMLDPRMWQSEDDYD